MKAVRVSLWILALGGCLIPSVQAQLRDRDHQALVSAEEGQEDQGEGEAAAPSRWIGVVCVPLDEVLRAHLDIPDDSGLAVQMVVPDGPADKAGLEEHDILLKVNGDNLSEQGQLMEAIREAGEDSIELTWLHKGDEVTKDIQPAKRPAEVGWQGGPEGQGSEEAGPIDEKRIKAWVEQMERQGGKRQPFRMRFFGPGLQMEQVRKPFEGSLSVEINREGEEPARIKVRRGDDSWEVTEEDIDELPDDIEGYVQGMLGRGHGMNFVMPSMPEMPAMPELPEMPPQIQEQFEELNERMEKMLEELQEMRESQDNDEDEDSVDA